MADEARAFRRLQWHAELVIPLDPDLVLVGPRDRSVTQRMLTALGFRVVELGFVSTISMRRASRSGGRRAGSAIPHGRGACWRGSMPRASGSWRRRGRRFERRCWSAMAAMPKVPASLAAAMLTQAGLEPPAGAPAGIGGFIPLERLLVLRPDLLVMHSLIEQPSDQGSVYLTHPALRELYPP